MIDLRVHSTGMDDIVIRLHDVAARLRDLSWLANRIASILLEQNANARRAGLDKDGQRFADLAPSTLRRRKGSGPPLAPRDVESRIIANARTSVEEITPGFWRVTLFWDDMPWLKYHVEGTPRMPRRDPVGITPDGQTDIRQAVNQALADILNGVL